MLRLGYLQEFQRDANLFLTLPEFDVNPALKDHDKNARLGGERERESRVQPSGASPVLADDPHQIPRYSNGRSVQSQFNVRVGTTCEVGQSEIREVGQDIRSNVHFICVHLEIVYTQEPTAVPAAVTGDMSRMNVSKPAVFAERENHRCHRCTTKESISTRLLSR